MKSTMPFILLVTISFSSCFAQCVEGLYKDTLSTTIVCVKNDSISIGYKRSEQDDLCYYYGTCHIRHDTIILDDNLLRHENAIVDTMYTDYPGIEIQLFEQYQDIPIGAPADRFSTFFLLTKNCSVWWDYQLDSKGRLFWQSLPDIKTNNGVIQLPIDTASYQNSKEFLIKGYGFFTEQILEIKPHCRYIIKQKNYNQNYRPMIPQEVLIEYNVPKNQIEITGNSSVDNQSSKVYIMKYNGEVKSCLKELLKRYPDLLNCLY